LFGKKRYLFVLLLLICSCASLVVDSKLEWRLLKAVRSAIFDYDMIKNKDKVSVAVSGGKDSSSLVYLLNQVRRRHLLGRRIDFMLEAVHLDQKQPGHNFSSLENWIDISGIPFYAITEDTYSIVVEKTKPGKSYCSLCSRLRRGILYSHAIQRQATLALGHHRDDALETLLLNMIHQGQTKAMPPRYIADRGINVIRPLAYCAEDDLAALAQSLRIPILPCNLCGSQPNSQRRQAKILLSSLDHFAGVDDARQNMLRALSDIRPSHLLDQKFRAACGLDPATGEPLPSSSNTVL